MNNDEKKTFDKCMKQIKRLLIEEKLTRIKLKDIQKTKLEVLRVLIDNDFCKEKLEEGK